MIIDTQLVDFLISKIRTAEFVLNDKSALVNVEEYFEQNSEIIDT